MGELGEDTGLDLGADFGMGVSAHVAGNIVGDCGAGGVSGTRAFNTGSQSSTSSVALPKRRKNNASV
jgi:hypothetical protein